MKPIQFSAELMGTASFKNLQNDDPFSTELMGIDNVNMLDDLDDKVVFENLQKAAMECNKKAGIFMEWKIDYDQKCSKFMSDIDKHLEDIQVIRSSGHNNIDISWPITCSPALLLHLSD